MVSGILDLLWRACWLFRRKNEKRRLLISEVGRLDYAIWRALPFLPTSPPPKSLKVLLQTFFGNTHTRAHLSSYCQKPLAVYVMGLDLVREYSLHSWIHYSKGINSHGCISRSTCMGHARKHSWCPAFLLRTFVWRVDPVTVKVYRGLMKRVSEKSWLSLVCLLTYNSFFKKLFLYLPVYSLKLAIFFFSLGPSSY